MKTAFTLALAVGVASASNLRTVAGGDIKFLRANPGATGMSSGQGDKLPLCAQYCQGKPTTCEMAFEFMEPQGCGGSCPQAMKEQLLMEMGCSPDTAATGGGDPANVEGGANNYATGAATDGTMKDCGPYGPENTFTCGKTCNMLCMDESGGGTMDGMNADSTMTGAATDGTMNGCGPFGPENTFTCGPTCNMKCMDESGISLHIGADASDALAKLGKEPQGLNGKFSPEQQAKYGIDSDGNVLDSGKLKQATAATGAKAEENEKGIAALLGLSEQTQPKAARPQAGAGSDHHQQPLADDALIPSARRVESTPPTPKAEQNEEQATPTALVCPAPELPSTSEDAPCVRPFVRIVGTSECGLPVAPDANKDGDADIDGAAENDGDAVDIDTDPNKDGDAAATDPVATPAVEAAEPVPNGDASYSIPGTGLRKVVSDWMADGDARLAVIKQYGTIENWDTSEVTSLKYVFYNFGSFNSDLSKWNTAAVTNMQSTFLNAYVFNADLSNWKTGAVTTMDSTFYKAKSFNADLSKWDVSSVTTLRNTFYYAKSFNADLSKWVVSSVTNMDATFRLAAAFNADLSKWDVSSVTNMGATFIGCPINKLRKPSNAKKLNQFF